MKKGRKWKFKVGEKGGRNHRQYETGKKKRKSIFDAASVWESLCRMLQWIYLNDILLLVHPQLLLYPFIHPWWWSSSRKEMSARESWISREKRMEWRDWQESSSPFYFLSFSSFLHVLRRKFFSLQVYIPLFRIHTQKESLIFIHIFFFLRMLNFPNKGSSLSPVSSSKKTLVVNAWSMRTKNEKHVFHSFLHPSHLLLSMSPSSSFFVHHCRCVSLFSLESFEPHLLHSFNDFNDYKTKKTRRLTTRDKDTQRDRRRFPL